MILAVLLTVLLLSIVSCSNTTGHSEYYVVPSMLSCPPERTCVTLGALLQNTSRYFTSNTLVKFKAEQYTIDTSTSIVIYRVKNLTLAGYSDQGTDLRNAMFRCIVPFNIIILNSTNIQLSNVAFSQCSSQITSKGFEHTEMYNILVSSDQLRSDFYNIFNSGLELKILTQAATIYFVETTNIVLDNFNVRDPPNGTAFLSVNVRRSIKMTRSYFEGGVRIWSLQDYNRRSVTLDSARYTIRQTQFHSTTANNYKQDALTLISDTRMGIALTVINSTITSKSKQFRRGYIFHVIMVNMNNFIIHLEELDFHHGKTLININDDKNDGRVKSSIIKLQNGYFHESAFQAHINNRKTNVLVENSTFMQPIESLYIKTTETDYPAIVHLRNIIIHGCAGYSAIFLLGSTVYFEKRNEISFCVSTQDTESTGSYSVYYTGGIASVASHIIFRGKMTFSENKGLEGAAIQASSDTQLYMEGEIIFRDNTAFNGGAISFYERSWMTIKHTASIYFIRNHAYNFGGAIHVGYESDQMFSKNNSCFYEPAECYEPAEWENVHIYKVMTFINNTANQAGDVIYAPYGEYAKSMCSFPTHNELGCGIKPFIKQITHYNSTNISAFSSKPTQVCFCTHSTTNCTLSFSIHEREYYPGEEFSISVVAIGINYGSTPAFVQGRILQTGFSRSESYLSRLEQTQGTYKTCTPLTYTIHAAPGVYTLIISLNSITLRIAMDNILLQETDDTDIDISCDKRTFPLVLSMTLKPCPKGFELSKESLVCICHRYLTEHNIECNINTQTVQRRSSYWIYPARDIVQNTSSVVVHKHCPYDYCNPQALHINLDNADEQCSHDRSGILCGGCQANKSMVLGSNRCRQCSSLWALLILPVALLAGLLLVIFLTVLNMTVSIGTINGLILYANILQPNTTVLFSSGKLSQFLRIFIAWVNLDIGIEVCFYDGLDAFVKVLFQLLFPAYIWGIMAFIIVGSHYSTRIAKICGVNSVQVLATLFLLSYSKILRVIITAFSVASLEYPNNMKLAWLQDGNVDYLKEKHIFLFIVALFLLLCLSLPYTMILLLSQCLQRWSNYQVISWIWKVKPLFDAYTGPLKDSHRYWTGLLLLFRVILYIVYSTNVGGDPAVNILATAIMVAGLLTYLTLIGGVYKSWPMSALECSYLLNLLVLTALTLYSSERRETYTDTLVMMAFCVTCLTISFHILLRIKAIRCVSVYLQKRKQNKDDEEEEYPQPAPPNPMPVTSQLVYFSKKDMEEPLLICDGAEEMLQQKPVEIN